MLKRSSTLALSSLLFISNITQAGTTAVPTLVERPPQFVMLAFDGSYKNNTWEFIRNYSKDNKNNGIDTRFTFFISPVYLLYSANKKNYQPPGYRLEKDSYGETVKVRNKGSAIGWGDNPQDISARLDEMNDAFTEGHEIGSHAMGHFDGGYKECRMNTLTRKCSRNADGSIDWKWDLRWTREDWRSEFDQFNKILDQVFTLNDIKPSEKYPDGLKFKHSIQGFRAPVLGVSDGLWPTLPEYGIKYDTSTVNTVSYWPTKSSYGTWDFPLVEIPEPGTAKKQISMDYNFCVRDSAQVLQDNPEVLNIKKIDPKTGTSVRANSRDCLTVVPPEIKAKIKKHMFDLYMSYFNTNYYGNRAPINIGHHFSQWMSGAYFEAYFDFATEVCQRPEVKCVTYSELMQFMDSKSSAEIQAYKNGQFAKPARPKAAAPMRTFDIQIGITEDEHNYNLEIKGKDAAAIRGMKAQVIIDGQKFDSRTVKKSVVRSLITRGSDVIIRARVLDRHNVELQTSSQILENVGTTEENLKPQNIETRWLEGHLPEAHQDNMESNQTFGH